MAAHAAKMVGDRIRCTCPDARKAEAVRNCLEGPITNKVPGSVLQLQGMVANGRVARSRTGRIFNGGFRDW